MPANLPMPKPPGVFSPWRKTGHFLLLLLALDMAAVAVIYVLFKTTPCFPITGGGCMHDIREYIATIASRAGGLMYVNAILLSAYSGLISFFHKRRVFSLLTIAIIMILIAGVTRAI